jgi:diaminohydroxyphosphoribosylaminopyrimidine deaminase/5-amino-6-(5-phosphoribosylamino)uracil reductase
MPEPPRADETQDARWMRQALQLAEASIGMASPNPRVGCVLVKHGIVVGRGAHQYDRKDHAEIVALNDAGPQARGATAYVTLEPCAHTGRTAPCAEALLKAGVARVVAATGDPNPLVNGQGFAMLREKDVAVTVGVMPDQARALNDGFARWIKHKLPFVTLKAGVSLDGRIAPPRAQKPAGSVAYLTGARSLLAVQKLRHSVDAVLTGIGTVLEDNPLLTDRSGGARRRALLRVVLDSGLQLPVASRLVQTAQNDVLVCTAATTEDRAHRERWNALEAAGIQVRAVGAAPEGGLNLEAVLRLLGEGYGVLNVLTEGGSRLNRALLGSEYGAPIADKLCLFYAPMFLGEAGVPLVAGGLPVPMELRRFTVAESGSDFRMEAYLRDPWRDF